MLRFKRNEVPSELSPLLTRKKRQHSAKILIIPSNGRWCATGGREEKGHAKNAPRRRDGPHPTASSSVETTRPRRTSAMPHNSISPFGGAKVQSSSPSRLLARSRSQSALKSAWQDRKSWRRLTAAREVRFLRYDFGNFIGQHELS